MLICDVVQVDSSLPSLQSALAECQSPSTSQAGNVTQPKCTQNSTVYSMCKGPGIKPNDTQTIDFSAASKSDISYCYDWMTNKTQDMEMLAQNQSTATGNITSENLEGQSVESTEAHVCIREVAPSEQVQLDNGKVSSQEPTLANVSSCLNKPYTFWGLIVKNAKMFVYDKDGGIKQEQDITVPLQRGSYYFKVDCTGRIHRSYFTQQDTAELVHQKMDMAESFSHKKPDQTPENENLLQAGEAVHYAVPRHNHLGTHVEQYVARRKGKKLILKSHLRSTTSIVKDRHHNMKPELKHSAAYLVQLMGEGKSRDQT